MRVFKGLADGGQLTDCWLLPHPHDGGEACDGSRDPGPQGMASTRIPALGGAQAARQCRRCGNFWDWV